MLGRITKCKGLYYCTVKDKNYLVDIDTNKKINNGDLVQIHATPNKETDSIKRSEITILKKVSSKAKFVDINESTPLFKRLEYRILDLRRPASHAKFILRSEINRILEILFHKNGYINVNTPLIVGSVLEGRVKTFDINFFGKEASLAMTKLVHLRYLICSDYEKIYDLSPVFVGGQHKTSSHVSEYYTFDWASSEESTIVDYTHKVDKILFGLLSKLLKYITTSNLNIDLKIKPLLKEIKNVKNITYYDLMKKYTYVHPEDKKVLEQFHLSNRVIDFAHNLYGEYIWIYEFPEEFKQFYCDTIMRHGKKVVLSSELWWNGIKVASVSFSNSDYKKTLDRIKTLELNPKNFKTYLNSINLGSSEAYLGSLYIERLMMVIQDIRNIKDTLLFPRATRGTVLDP